MLVLSRACAVESSFEAFRDFFLLSTKCTWTSVGAAGFYFGFFDRERTRGLFASHRVES